MRTTFTPRSALVLGLAAFAACPLSACRGEPKQSDYTTPSGVVLSPDAVDPTVRAKIRGEGVFREADETPGTLAPMDPDRRTHGFGSNP